MTLHTRQLNVLGRHSYMKGHHKYEVVRMDMGNTSCEASHKKAPPSISSSRVPTSGEVVTRIEWNHSGGAFFYV